MKIFIDPGHGGSDSGAVGNFSKESDVVLKFSKILLKLLKYNGFETNISRTVDRDLTLKERCKTANEQQSDLVISIHANSFNSKTANGTETLIIKSGGQAEKIAKIVQNNLIKETGLSNRGVKEQNLAILRDTNCPAILIELAFISNEYEEKLLNDQAWQLRCAKSICASICQYFNITYKDVSVMSDYDKHWAKKSIDKILSLKIMNGFDDGTFRPDKSLTRGELAQTLVNFIKYIEKCNQ